MLLQGLVIRVLEKSCGFYVTIVEETIFFYKGQFSLASSYLRFSVVGLYLQLKRKC